MKNTNIPKVIDEEKTIDALQRGYSIARYGDGEFQLIFAGGVEYIIQTLRGNKPQVFGNGGLWFSWRLKKILISDLDKLLIGIPNIFFQDAVSKWKSSYFYEHKQDIVNVLNPSKIYYSAFFTRYNRRSRQCDTHWNRLKAIWQGKSICIVGPSINILENEIFHGASQIDFISCPSSNAWGYGLRYHTLLKKCQSNYSDIILLMVGPVATLLAYDLCKQGRQCIDIGQLARIYIKYLKINK